MTIPEMKPVKSSNVESVGYHPESKTLHVKFKGGGHYTHTCVSASEHAALMSAESVGKAYNSNIKGIFPHQKLDLEQK